ncbi:MAG: Trk system potassium transporter TrkA [Actinobacteria bacterium]|nr:Trk system potassium transporter TrkA [Actinomycetota bacterium]
MKIFIVGAGQVGATIVQALHGEHDLTIFDLDQERLAAISQRFDVATIEGNGASRRVLSAAGIASANLLIACTSRDESNIVSAMISKACSSRTTTVVRTTNPEYLEVWREGQLDVDFIVSSEVETAYAISRTIGVPAARQTDVFAEGQVQLVEFDITGSADPRVVGVPLREAQIPPDSRVAAIIRGDSVVIPRGDEKIQLGERIVVIGSPQAAQAWGELISPGTGKVRDVVIYGAGRAGTAIARLLLEQGVGVRMIEASRERARDVAAELPDARVYNATGFDPDFLERERISEAQVAVFAMRDDMKNHFAATLAKVHGARFTVAIVHDTPSVEVFEHAGIDVTVNPRQITAEEIVRFAHDPRTQQVVMLEGDRFEVLDITTRRGSEFVGLTFKEMPIRGALIGAIVRDGVALFPHGDDVLRAGDRAIIFTESRRVAEVEKAL